MKNQNLFFKKNAIKNAGRGFSLIELMVVVTLMAILVGIGTVYVMGRLAEGKITTARTQAYEIAKALDLYKLQTGSYPNASEGLDVLANPPRGQPLMEKVPMDPWGNPYNYAIPGTHNPRSFDVWSDGPEGNAENAELGIGNWQPE
ncbi:MAG: type II secretion system major pseudopilin GspG [Myxococcales bacterium]|nr:type II secretion system major pseudopilin GspG [Myxococcales bacterium]USN49884.1 MAG: type II secretion system major pseudopilin GspG [Myxococcales bacterium]